MRLGLPQFLPIPLQCLLMLLPTHLLFYSLHKQFCWTAASLKEVVGTSSEIFWGFSPMSSHLPLLHWQLPKLLNFERGSLAIARESTCAHVLHHSSIWWPGHQAEIVHMFCKGRMPTPFFCELASIKDFDSFHYFSSVAFNINATIFPACVPILFCLKSLHLSPVLFSPFWLSGRGKSAI